MKTAAPEDLTRDQKRELSRWHLDEYGKRWTDESARKGFLRREVGKCLDHHGAKGTKFVDWYRATKNWIRKSEEIRGVTGPRGEPRMSPPPGPKGKKPFESGGRALSTVGKELRNNADALPGQLDLLGGK